MSQRSGYFGPILQPIGLAINKGGLPAWSPRALFAAGEQGAWYDPSDLSTLFQDSAGTTPVTATGQPVGLVKDKSGRGNHASQATATARPTLQQDSGGRYYLSFDGVDDGLNAAMNLSGANKATLFSAVRKLSDTAVSVVFEHGPASPPVLAMFAPVNTTNKDFAIRSGGSVIATATAAAPAPLSAVVTGLCDIPGDSVQIRVSGVAQPAFVSDQGTGNYANETLHIGGRSGGTLPFNGRIYGLIVRGAASTAAQIASAERYLAARSGVTL